MYIIINDGFQFSSAVVLTSIWRSDHLIYLWTFLIEGQSNSMQRNERNAIIFRGISSENRYSYCEILGQKEITFKIILKESALPVYVNPIVYCSEVKQYTLSFQKLIMHFMTFSSAFSQSSILIIIFNFKLCCVTLL